MKETENKRKASLEEVQEGLENFLEEHIKAKKRLFYKSPVLRQFWGEEQHEFQSWKELFFDLIYVAMAFKLGEDIAEVVQAKENYRAMIPYFLSQYIPMYILWFNRTQYMSRFELDSAFHSILDDLYGLMLAFMALFIGSRTEILESFAAHELNHSSESAINRNNASMDIMRAGQEKLGVNFNILLAYSVAYLFCQAIELFRCLEMWLVVAHHGTKKEFIEEVSVQQNAIIAMAKMECLRLAVSMILTCVGIVAAFGGTITLSLFCLFLTFVVLIISKFVHGIQKLLLGNDFGVVPINVQYVVGRMGEFTMLLMGEGVLQIVVSAVDSSHLEGHIGTFAISFAVLAELHFMAFYVIPTEADFHAFKRSGASSFLIYILFPYSAGSLVFVGVSLKLVLKNQYKLEDEENDYIRWMLCVSLLVASSSFIHQSLVHMGWQKIVHKSHSGERQDKASPGKLYFPKIFFHFAYSVSPMLFLLVGSSRWAGSEGLAQALFLLLFIISLGRIQKSFQKDESHQKERKPHHLMSQLLSYEDSLKMRKLISARFQGTLTKEDEMLMKESVAHVKEKIANLLNYLRNRSFTLGAKVSRTNVLDANTIEEEKLQVDELRSVIDLISEQLELFSTKQETTILNETDRNDTILPEPKIVYIPQNNEQLHKRASRVAPEE